MTENEPADSRLPGGLDKRFRLVRLLGSGKDAAVYQAVRLSDQVPLALKLPQVAGISTRQRELLLKAMEKWHNLNHPNVVRLYEFGMEPIPYAAMEFMPGSSLRARIRLISLIEAMSIARQMAAGLSHVHDLGWLHLDIKPENVLFDAAGSAKVSDWGISHILQSGPRGTAAIPVATVYSSPEQISPGKWGPADRQTDIWQFGVVLYEMIVGHPPFSARDIGTTAGLQEAPSPSEVRPDLDIPPELNDLVRRCLQLDTLDRYHDFDPIQATLESVLRPVSPTEAFESPPEARRTPTSVEIRATPGAEKDATAALGSKNPLARSETHMSPQVNHPDASTEDRVTPVVDITATFAPEAQAAHVPRKTAPPGEQSEASRWNEQGLAMAELGKYEESLSAFDHALEVDPDNPETWNNKGNSFYSLGKYREAVACFDRALRLDPDYADTWNNKGMALIELGQFEIATACYDNLLRIDRQDAGAWNNRGFALARLGKNEQAVASYEHALKINTAYADAWNNKAAALLILEQYQEAITCCNMALAVDTSFADAWNNKGNAFSGLEDFKEALSSYNQAVELAPGDASFWNNKGSALFDLGRFEDALASYDRATKLNSAFSAAWNNRGLAFDELGEYQDAIDSYDRALQEDPENAGAWNNRGLTLARLEKYREAIDSYNESLELDHDNAQAWNNLGIALEELGEYEEAIASYDRALALEPDFAEAQVNRSQAQEKIGTDGLP